VSQPSAEDMEEGYDHDTNCYDCALYTKAYIVSGFDAPFLLLG